MKFIDWATLAMLIVAIVAGLVEMWGHIKHFRRNGW